MGGYGGALFSDNGMILRKIHMLIMPQDLLAIQHILLHHRLFGTYDGQTKP